MITRQFIIIAVVGGVIFSIVPSWLYASDQDKVIESVNQLYEIILNGPKEEIIPTRAKIRKMMESYFHDQGVPLKSYSLPIKYGRWKITQGNTTKYTHQGKNQFSWDFELVDVNGHLHPDGISHKEKPKENYSYGMPIYAVEKGRVWLRDGGVDGKEPSNIIVIHHDDGTRAIYDHIRPNGFKVKKGDHVKRGQIIGYIGYTGTSYPHIHFSVKMKKANNWTLPVRFKRYFLVNPKTSEVKKVDNGVLLEGDIIAATSKEAQTPFIPKNKDKKQNHKLLSEDDNAKNKRFLLHKEYGGKWRDAEKSKTNPEDDWLCWAAPAANALAWTRWAKDAGFADEDVTFKYFQDHWTDDGGGSPYRAWHWWFTGVDPFPKGARVDVPGGGFGKKQAFPTDTWVNKPGELYRGVGYKMLKRDPLALKKLLDDGYAVVIQIIKPLGNGKRDSHMISLWGYTYDKRTPFKGIFVTDSDDNKKCQDAKRAKNRLRYYKLNYKDDKWWFRRGGENWYIIAAYALARKPR